MNIWGVVQPSNPDLKNAVNSLTLLIDIADIAANSTLQLVNDDGNVFQCTNNPLIDYYDLTKSLKILEEAEKVLISICKAYFPYQ